MPQWLSQAMDLVQTGAASRDPLSPYLFLLVADVLQSMIKKAGASIRHPLIDNVCPVLQYADGTLILVRAAEADVDCLKQCLDLFAEATGLKINFHKSTMVSMHVPEALVDSLATILQCKRDTFPQTYLGLLLSNTTQAISFRSPDSQGRQIPCRMEGNAFKPSRPSCAHQLSV